MELAIILLAAACVFFPFLRQVNSSVSDYAKTEAYRSRTRSKIRANKIAERYKAKTNGKSYKSIDDLLEELEDSDDVEKEEEEQQK